MTELRKIAGELSALYRSNTANIADGSPSEIRWPYTEMIYQIVSILKEIEQLHDGGFFDRDYITEKCNLIIQCAEGIKFKVSKGRPDDSPF